MGPKRPPGKKPATPARATTPKGNKRLAPSGSKNKLVVKSKTSTETQKTQPPEEVGLLPKGSASEVMITVEGSVPSIEDLESVKSDSQISIAGSKADVSKTSIALSESHSTTKVKEPDCPDKQALQQETLLQSLKALQEYILSDATGKAGPDYLEGLKAKVQTLTSDMDNLKQFCDNSQKQLETVMLPMKQITDKIFHTITPSETTDESHKKTLEELQLEARQKHLHVQLAKINDELLRVSKIAVETETAAVEASQACAEAVEVAKQIQQEYEEKKRQEEEIIKQHELEKQKEAERIMEETRKRIEEEKKEAALIKLREKEARQWQLIILNVDSVLEFDGGIGCIIRADPQYFKKSNVICEVVNLQEAGFNFPDNEEVISNVIELSPTSDTFQLKCKLCIFIPHNLSRQQAATREPVMKMEMAPGRWVEVQTKDTTLDKYREVKFAQGDVKSFCKLIVVSRFKKDLMKLKRRGGRFVSKVDPRVTFSTTPETFPRKEKISVQIQPVDALSMAELKAKLPEAKVLLTSSAIFNIEWDSRSFGTPITMTLPIPPNPIVVKKAAAARAAKEAKAKPMPGEEDEPKPAEVKAEVAVKKETKAITQRPKTAEAKKDDKKDDKKETGKKKDGKKKDEGEKKDVEKKEGEQDDSSGLAKPIKWYMGQYAVNTEDERDRFYFLQMNEKKKRWQVESITIDPVKIDMIEISISNPVDRFLVFRTALSANTKDVEQIASTLVSILLTRTVQVIVRQKLEDACDVVVYVAPVSKMDRIMRKLQDEDYDVGPAPSNEVNLKDGDLLELAFRGNVRCIDQIQNPRRIFNTNLETKFHINIQERDIYVQKSYEVYRGFIQLRRLTKVITMPVRKVEVEEKPVAKPKPDEADEEEADEKQSKVEDEPIIVAPLKPIIEFKPSLITEVLITFPKNLDQLAPKALRKAPVTYISLNDPVSVQVLAKIATELKSGWPALGARLGIKPVNLSNLHRDAVLKKRSEFDQKYDMLLLWVKTIEKSENKATILANALEACGRDDLAKYLDEIKRKVSYKL